MPVLWIATITQSHSWFSLVLLIVDQPFPSWFFGSEPIQPLVAVSTTIIEILYTCKHRTFSSQAVDRATDAGH
jgi:hypothetical protein